MQRLARAVEVAHAPQELRARESRARHGQALHDHTQRSLRALGDLQIDIGHQAHQLRVARRLLQSQQIAGTRFVRGAARKRVVCVGDERGELQGARALGQQLDRSKRSVELDRQLVVARGQCTEAHAPRRGRARADRRQERATECGARIGNRDHTATPRAEAAEYAIERAQREAERGAGQAHTARVIDDEARVTLFGHPQQLEGQGATIAHQAHAEPLRPREHAHRAHQGPEHVARAALEETRQAKEPATQRGMLQLTAPVAEVRHAPAQVERELQVRQRERQTRDVERTELDRLVQLHAEHAPRHRQTQRHVLLVAQR